MRRMKNRFIRFIILNNFFRAHSQVPNSAAEREVRQRIKATLYEFILTAQWRGNEQR